MDVTVNRTAINLPSDLDTWGDLLDWVESQYLNPGQCITHVYMDGSEVLNYRDRLICDQDADCLPDIVVESGDFDTVVRESLHELNLELNRALTSSRTIVRLIKKHQEQDAYALMGQLLDSVRIFFTIFSEDLGWPEVATPGKSRAEISAALERALTQLIAAQENQHSVWICEVLEYEITPILESWQALTESTCVHID